MRKFHLISLAFLIILLANACKTKQTIALSAEEVLLKQYQDSYRYAKKVNDYQVMINSIYGIAALKDSMEFGGIMDSLCVIYYNLEMNHQAYDLTKYLLDERGFYTNGITRVRAYSAQKLGKFEEAIENFTIIAENGDKNELTYRYEIGLCQIDLEVYEDAVETFNRIAMHALAKTLSTTIYYQNKEYTVPFYAASLNSLGYTLIQLGDIDNALIAYNDALESAPDFDIVKRNIAVAEGMKNQ